MSDERGAVVAEGLTESECELIAAFRASPAFGPFVKVLENAIRAQYGVIESSSDVNKIFNHQGRINGMRYAQNICTIITKELEKFKHNRQVYEERVAKTGPRRNQGSEILT